MTTFTRIWSLKSNGSLVHHSLYYDTHTLQAFSFLALFLFVGMLIYFFVARYVLRWTTHGENPPNKEYEQTDGNDDTDY